MFKFVDVFSKSALDAENFRCCRSVAAEMASSADVDSWKALGGRVDQSSGSWYTATGKPDLGLAAPRTQFSSKLYAGEFYSNWKDAAQYLEAHMAKGTPCRDLDDQITSFTVFVSQRTATSPASDNHFQINKSRGPVTRRQSCRQNNQGIPRKQLSSLIAEQNK